MKQLFRTWLLVLAMIAGGASSLLAQAESDYFRLTKKPGTPDESISYYETFDGAYWAADNGDKITLLKDYTATGRVDINMSITLDLNDHTISGDFDADLISVNYGATLEIVDNGTDTDTKGTITNNYNGIRNAINVYGGCTLHASGVRIACPNGNAIYNRGTAVVNGCVLSGYTGIFSNLTTTVSNTSISGTDRGIYVSNGTTTIGSGVSFSGYSDNGIFYADGTVILKALPTFSGAGNGYTADIYIWGGHSLTFGEGTFSAVNPKIKLYLRDNNGHDVNPATYTNAIAVGYRKYVRDESGLIDPNEVFVWYNGDYTHDFVVNAAGEVIFYPGVASVTAYNSGSTPTISYYATLDDALTVAAEAYAAHSSSTPAVVPKVTLFDDVTGITSSIRLGSGGYNCDLVLDLNGHTLSGGVDYLLYVLDGRTLTVEDSGEGGRIVNTGTRAIRNFGTTNLNGVTIGGHNTIIENRGTMTVSDGTIDVSDATYGIDNYGTLTFNGLPKFKHGTNSVNADIQLHKDKIITFGAGTYEAPENPIVIKTSDLPPYTITSGYSTYVRDADNNPIDPGKIFVANNKTDGDVIAFNANKSEAILKSYDLAFSLSDKTDNSSEIILNRYGNVTLTDRIITRDGTWNTLCLPFDVTLSGSPLQGFTVKKLNARDSKLDGDGQLTIEFIDVTDKIVAGKPYILSWPPTGIAPVEDPVLVFSGVTITSTEPEAVTFSNDLGDPCQFVGQYSPFEINDGTATEGFHSNVNNIDEILFLATTTATHSTVLGYSQSPRVLRPCRAHFYVPAVITESGDEPVAVRSVTMNFGDGTDATGVVELKNSRIEELNSDDGWYSMDGRRLQGKPAQKGVYIHQGRKIVVR